MRSTQKTLFFILFISTILIGTFSKIYAQEQTRPKTSSSFKGIEYTSTDSSFYGNFRFRMQNRLKFTNSLDGEQNNSIEARIRRLRMRIDGYVYSPKLRYNIQLAFTRSDLDFDATGVPNLIKDAVLFYDFNKDFYISLGVNKLPGNRQRITSSGSQQFAERSIVDSKFNLDIDYGIAANLSKKLGSMPYTAKLAVSTGEGRPINKTDDGLAYTGRVEILPLGKFTNNGNYFEGDLEREVSPKLAVAGGYSYNDRTNREGGQTGRFVKNPLTLKTLFFDAIFKYRGFAYTAEYMKRDVDNPFNFLEKDYLDENDNTNIHIYKGQGINQQLSYIFNSDYEVAGRYTYLRPHDDIKELESQVEVVELGVSKYLKAHKLKLQLNGHYNFRDGNFNNHNNLSDWGATFQIELGI